MCDNNTNFSNMGIWNINPNPNPNIIELDMKIAMETFKNKRAARLSKKKSDSAKNSDAGKNSDAEKNTDIID